MRVLDALPVTRFAGTTTAWEELASVIDGARFALGSAVRQAPAVTERVGGWRGGGAWGHGYESNIAPAHRLEP